MARARFDGSGKWGWLRALALAPVLANAGCGDSGETGRSETGTQTSDTTGDGDGDDDGDGDTSGDGDGDLPGDGDGDVAGDGDGDTPLNADAGPSRYALVGEPVELDGSNSTGATLYQWNFGDGSGQPEPSAEPAVSHSYAAPGRYYPVLTVFDGEGDSQAANLTLTATHPSIHTPRTTGTVIAEPGAGRIAVVSPDSDELLIIEQGGPADDPSFELTRHAVCDGPRVVGPAGSGRFVVACPEVDAVQLVDVEQGPGAVIELAHGARPSAALELDGRVWITLTGPGALASVELDQFGQPGAVSTYAALTDVRGLALWPDGRLALSRWRSPDNRAELLVVDPSAPEAGQTLIPLAYDPTPPSDTEIGGVPTYLDPILVSPIGNEVAIPSLQANFLHGEYLTGEVLSFETTVRAVVSFIELGEPGPMGWIGGGENFDRRKQFDNRGFATAGVYSSRGDYLFVAMRGSRTIERYDVLSGSGAGTILDAGYAPSGLALSDDDRYLFVDAALSRELRVYDVSNFDVLPQPLASLALVEDEPLTPELLRGKQLFNDSFDPRLAKHGYIACAHCHLDGEADRRTWDFTDRGEGLRNTISLRGRAGLAHGPLHWSANFDEVQDFEHDMRGPFAGFGLLDDVDWNNGTVSQTLGDPKAGLSADLDALAAYVTSLASYPRSPHRGAQGQLGAEALAGQVLFESDALGCIACHSGPALTDSSWLGPTTPLLHDVGTLGPGSGQRLAGPLLGIDTPTLHGLWNSPPYLHDGSAEDLHALLTTHNPDDAHGVTSQLSLEQLDALVAYLLSFEGG